MLTNFLEIEAAVPIRVSRTANDQIVFSTEQAQVSTPPQILKKALQSLARSTGANAWAYKGGQSFKLELRNQVPLELGGEDWLQLTLSDSQAQSVAYLSVVDFQMLLNWV